MATLVLPVTKADDDDPGVVAVTGVAEATIAIAAGGFFKIAAMGSAILWKLGDDAVTITTGSYLAAADQEIIFVPAGGETLRFILSTDAAAVAGEINLTVANIQEIPGVDPRNYSS